MANQHTVKALQTKLEASRAALSQSQSDKHTLEVQLDNLSNLAADIFASIDDALRNFHAPSAYLEGQVMYKKPLAPLDPVHNCVSHMRNGLLALQNIIHNGNNKHAEIIGVSTDTKAEPDYVIDEIRGRMKVKV